VHPFQQERTFPAPETNIRFSRGMFFRALREQLGSILCTKNREPRYASGFQRAAKNLPRSFFLLFASIFLLSFAKEGRKTRNLY
jgi:hypothetical protein